MNIKKIAALAHKEWREILRDRIFFSLAFIVPFVWMIVFGYGLTMDVENIPFAIIDHDRTPMSREYSSRFISSRYFDFKGYLRDSKEADRLLADGHTRIVIAIPEHFEERLLSGRTAEAQTLIDGTFPPRAQTMQGYVEAINRAFSAAFQAEFIARRLGVPLSKAEAMVMPLKIEVRYLYNQELRSIWSIAPSLMMFTLMLAPPLLTALSVVREKETGSIYNIYSSTVTRAEFLAGKLIPNIAISAINAAVLWLVAVYYFGAPFKGALGFFFPATLLYIACTSGIGLLVSLLVRTQQAALLITIVITIITVILYSGLLVPISSLSKSAYLQAHLFPPMYYNDIALGVFLKGAGLEVLWQEVAVLAVYGAVLLFVGYLLFTKRPRA